MNKLSLSYGENLSALDTLLSKSPCMIYLGEDRIHMPMQSLNAANKGKVSQTHRMTVTPQKYLDRLESWVKTNMR